MRPARAPTGRRPRGSAAKTLKASFDAFLESEIDLLSELDDLIGGELEVGRRARRVASEDREEPLAEATHAPRRGGEERLATEVVGVVAEIDRDAAPRCLLDELGHGGRLHESDPR